MRAVATRRRNEVQTTSRRRRFSIWKAASWTAIIAPWAIVGGTTAAIAWIVWSKGGPDSFAERARSEGMLASLRIGFEIKEVWVDGLKRSDRQAVLNAVGAIRGEPILEFNPRDARDRLLSLPWIDEAVVARSLPNRIDVRLNERQPLALWQKDQKLRVIDRAGTAIPGVDPAGFAHLPIIVGDGAAAAASAFLELLQGHPVVAHRLTAAVFVGARRWDLRLDDRIDVVLPARAPEAALARLAKLDREHGLLAKDIIAIDLRLEDRLIVKLGPDAADALSVATDAKQGQES